MRLWNLNAEKAPSASAGAFTNQPLERWSAKFASLSAFLLKAYLDKEFIPAAPRMPSLYVYARGAAAPSTNPLPISLKTVLSFLLSFRGVPSALIPFNTGFVTMPANAEIPSPISVLIVSNFLFFT